MSEHKLPDSIQRQIDEADILAAELGQTPPSEEVAGAEPEPQPDPTPEPEITPEPTPEPEPQPEPAPAPDPEPDKWEARYRTLQSKYDAEVPRLSQQNAQLGDQLSAIQQQMVDLTEKLNRQPETPEATDTPLISEKDESEFGADLIDMTRRVSREELGKISGQLNQLASDVSALKTQLETVGSQAHQTTAQIFDGRLLALVPDWETVNTEPEWIKWLEQVDPLSGTTRQQQLNFAHAQLNADRVAAFFTAYKDTLAPPPPPADDPTPPPLPSPEADLSRQVTPGNSRDSRPAEDQLVPEERIWTEAEIQQALDPRNLKQLNSAQVTQLMNEIDAAAATGRVQPSSNRM